jgi:hypothetical protein
MSLVKLKDLMKVVRNKANRQYYFVIKKKAMVEADLTPNDILETPILLIKTLKRRSK